LIYSGPGISNHYECNANVEGSEDYNVDLSVHAARNELYPAPFTPPNENEKQTTPSAPSLIAVDVKKDDRAEFYYFDENVKLGNEYLYTIY